MLSVALQNESGVALTVLRLRRPVTNHQRIADTVTQLMLLTNVSFVMANTAHRIGAPTIALAEDRKGISHDE